MRQQKLLAAESKSSPPKASQPTASRTGKRDKRSPDSGDKMLPPPPRRLAEGSRKLSQQVWDAACKRLDLEVLASQRGPPCRQWFIHGCCFKGERCAYHHDGVAGSYAPTPAAPQGVGTSVAKAPEPVDLDQFPAGWAPRFDTPISRGRSPRWLTNGRLRRRRPPRRQRPQLGRSLSSRRSPHRRPHRLHLTHDTLHLTTCISHPYIVTSYSLHITSYVLRLTVLNVYILT